ncbi:MAG: hypothetical protein JSW58_02720 [Candidatus Latescibacterota bacterium]|nr:MAG: hypothetical protein JSW58_02720 [Candidatus Latescibacterota bacterium]
MNPGPRWLLIFLGLILTGTTLYISRLGDLTQEIPKFLVSVTIAFIVYVAATIVLARARFSDRWILSTIFVVAVVCRLVSLSATPSLSNDIYRYLWEGRVIEAGYNPFALPPAAPELEFLRDDDFANINHNNLETIYPPLAQGVFFLGAVIDPDVTTQKVLFVLFDLATIVVVVLMLIRRRKPPSMAVVYAWSPLVVIEFSHSGHVDSVGIFFLVLAVYLWQIRTKSLSVVSLALSFLSKYLSLLLVPFVLLKKRYAPWLVLFVVITFLGYLPFADASGKLISSLRIYGRHWEFNSALFSLANGLIGHPDWVRLGFLAFVAAFSLYEGSRRSDLVKYTFRVIGCSLLLTPTLYPWYLCWLIPFLCFHPSRAWIYLSGAVVASYWVWVTFAGTGQWELGAWIMVIEYVPFFGLLVLESYRSTVKRRRAVE